MSDLPALRRDREVVFCTPDGGGGGGYGWFCCEADVMLLALGREVETGRLTFVQLKEAWEPYREVWPELYDLDEEEWFEVWWPNVSADLDWPATRAFEREVDALNIPGVGYLGGYSMSTGEIFEVEDAEALETLREELADGYKIVVKEDIGDYVPLAPEEARALIEEERGR